MVTTHEMKTEQICSHEIEFWFRDNPDKNLDEYDIEHIQNLLIENYVAGELCQYDNELDEEYYGWWQIKRD